MMNPKGLPIDAWSEDQILIHCIGLLTGLDDDDLGIDDALWCYAYEPRCQKLRLRVYKATGVSDKSSLIDWDTTHTNNERLALLESLISTKNA